MQQLNCRGAERHAKPVHVGLGVGFSHATLRPVARQGGGDWQHRGSVRRSFEGNGAKASEEVDVNPRVVSQTLLDIQKNMLAINTSRVKMAGALQAATEALQAKDELLVQRAEALIAAEQKIEELEAEMERLRAEKDAAVASYEASTKATPSFYIPDKAPEWSQSTQQQSMANPSSHQSHLAYTPYPPQQQQQQQAQVQHQPHQVQAQVPQQAAPPAPPPPPPPPAVPGVIKVTYITGWHDCFIHYSVDGKAWTNTPGQKMKSAQESHQHKVVEVQGNKLEFVFTNGHNEWDSPGQWTDKQKNYLITTPGTYRIKSGKMERIGE